MAEESGVVAGDERGSPFLLRRPVPLGRVRGGLRQVRGAETTSCNGHLVSATCW